MSQTFAQDDTLVYSGSTDPRTTLPFREKKKKNKKKKYILLHVADNTIRLASAIVLGGLARFEHFDSGVTLDLEFLAQIHLLSAVNLSNLDCVLLEGGSGDLVLGSWIECGK